MAPRPELRRKQKPPRTCGPRRAKVCALLALASLLALPLPCPAAPVAFRNVENYTVAGNETLDKQLWLITDTARFEGTARDDLFVVSRLASFAGASLNDVWCIAEEIELEGYVADHARLLAGRQANVRGRVGSTLMAAGNRINVGRAADIEGDALLLGETVTLEGHVKGRAVLAGHQATLGGRVDGSVRIMADDIVVLPQTVIGGDLVYTSDDELFLDPSVELKGQMIRREVAARRGAPQALRFQERLSVQAFFLAGAFLAGTAWIGLFPATSGRAVRQLRQSGWRSLLTGVVAFCLLPMLALFLFVTLIGIPLSLLLVLTYLLVLYLARLVAALWLGAVLLRRRGPQPFGQAVTALGAGLLVLNGLALVPAVSTIAWFGATLFGLGGLTLGVLSAERAAPAPMPPVSPPLPPVIGGDPSASREKPAPGGASGSGVSSR